MRSRLCHALEELEGLFELGVDVVGLQSLAHAAFDVRAHDLLVGAFEERLRGEKLVGDVHAVGGRRRSSANAVELAAGNFQLAADGITMALMALADETA